MKDTQINEKGARDYIKAARILSDSDEVVTGPLNHCQGLAIEIALKVCIAKQSKEIPKGRDGHNLLVLRQKCPHIVLTQQQLADLQSINTNYIGDGSLSYPSRYRASRGRVVTSPGQDAVESLLKSILSQQ
ncbi:MAG: hypothetical protein AAFX44_15835 [Pseudomonadota bacterium]